MKPSPIVFVSYSHDSQEHSDWVLQLATRLRSDGVEAILDRWHLRLGQDLAAFMERGLSDSHRVLCICSQQMAHLTLPIPASRVLHGWAG